MSIEVQHICFVVDLTMGFRLRGDEDPSNHNKYLNKCTNQSS